jgi:hypothetical protein
MTAQQPVPRIIPPNLALVYAGKGADIAHLVERFALDHVSFAPPSTLCGRARPYRPQRDGWLGWRTAAEVERAKELPLCKLCERRSTSV